MTQHLSKGAPGSSLVIEHRHCADYENVAFARDEESGLRSIIVIHSRKRGPALGGCRMWHYANEQEALTDALRLAQGMTYKAALADVPCGGGKGVIIGHPRQDKTPALFEAYGRFVDSFRGQYYTGEDVGTSLEDMNYVQRTTSYVVGTLKSGGDPSPVTATGVFAGIEAAIRQLHGPHAKLSGRRVAVQGLGQVGRALCVLLNEAGARLVVADIDPASMDQAKALFQAEVVDPDRIYEQEADVFAPCALGGVLNQDTIPLLNSEIVAGSANNQLLKEEDGGLLHARGILYAPDYVINSGGLINVAQELAPGGYDREATMIKVRGIGSTLQEIFRDAGRENLPPDVIANRLAEQRLAAAG
mgnify:CR=1 FL=1